MPDDNYITKRRRVAATNKPPSPPLKKKLTPMEPKKVAVSESPKARTDVQVIPKAKIHTVVDDTASKAVESGKTMSRRRSASVAPPSRPPSIAVHSAKEKLDKKQKDERPDPNVLTDGKKAATTTGSTPQRRLRPKTPDGTGKPMADTELLHPDTGARISRPGSAPPTGAVFIPPPAKKFRLVTIRISNIPKRWLPKELTNRLHTHFSPDIKLRSIYSSAMARDTLVATVDLLKMPPRWEADLNSNLPFRLPVGGDRILDIDRSFHGLTTLYTVDKPSVDIIAVTGLSGHALGSWMSPGDNTLWLRDFLPNTIPQARILSYGYDTVLIENRNKSSIPDLAKSFLGAIHAARLDAKEESRPCIFIAHSLGGLVVKEAVAQASISEPYSRLFKATHAFLFFGVPNLGLNERAVEQWLKMLKDQPNKEFIRSLQVDGDGEPTTLLAELAEKFRKSVVKLEGVKVCAFYEKRKSSIVVSYVRQGGEVSKRKEFS